MQTAEPLIKETVTAGSTDHPAELFCQNNLSTLAQAVQRRNATGRGSSKKVELYGIKKLRELILELAVRGKLVPQNPEDEPASVLLERIAEERARLVEEKKIKKPKKLPEIGEDEKPFELPEGWEWTRLSNIGRDWGQKKPDQDFTYIDVGAINKELGVINEPAVLSASKAPSRARKLVKEGTVIYSTVRPYLLNIAVIDNSFSPEPIASTAFAIIHPLAGMTPSYIYRYLRSPSFVKYVESCQTGIAYPAINDKQFFSGVIAIPPEEEQHRIVTKVDELMALCDQIEQKTETSLSAHTTLVDNLLATLTDSANAEELEPNWQRIASHFTTLFSTEESIDLLKQTILQLAVMGKLVRQDPNDEPAAKLLERIADEKARLIKEKKIKKQKALPPITEEEKPFVLPEGWGWIKFDHIAKNEKNALKAGPFGSALKKSMYAKFGYKIYGQEQVISGDENLGDYFIDEEKYLSLESCKVQPDDILISLVGTIGKVLIISDKARAGIINPRLVKLSLFRSICRKYIRIILGSRLIQDELYAKSHGSTMNVLNLGLLRKLVLPLPPVEEQSRIVTKVDQLMTLCDQIKTRLQQQQQTRLHLADAMVEKALV